ncbi:TldD/PmbA family protein [Candidatus Methylomirabilis sp.]|uniref:TldD/PmbA family protein n=1 Tax=Candidatus Methylomirabilis tolerans TaxID=3123416 RepID=A0AAJ1AGS5_9BACT|nr:TldD/PmbA family protein [Candidatus Methylomirabilis sp.]
MISRQIVEDVLQEAKRKGATATDLVLVENELVTAQVRLRETEMLRSAREVRLGLRLFFDKRSATSSTSDLSKESLARLVEDTAVLAKAIAHDEYSGLPLAEECAKDIPDLHLYDPDGEALTVKDQLDRAKAAEDAALSSDSRITNSEGAEFTSNLFRVIYGSSQGFLGEYRGSTFSLAVSPIASSEDGMQRDHWYSRTRHLGAMESPEAIGKRAAERALGRLGARKITTQEVPVIFDPETATNLLRIICGALCGPALYRGASFLVGKLGEQIAAETVSVYDDGTLPGYLGSKPFDGEGLPTRRNTIVENGVLRSYLLDSYSARKLGMKPTGNASRGAGDSPTAWPTNFYLQSGPHEPAEIIRSVDAGLYVTELIGFGVNLVTGDYSQGAVGFWIEKGELTYPVEEITIAGNLKEMLLGIEMVGNDLSFRQSVVAPTFKIRRMTVAGH